MTFEELNVVNSIIHEHNKKSFESTYLLLGNTKSFIHSKVNELLRDIEYCIRSVEYPKK